MANLILAYPNRIDSATLSGGSWQTPLTNLQDRVIRHTARSTDTTLASTQFDIDLGKDHATKCVILVNHNLSDAAKWRARSSNVAGDFTTNPLSDSGWMDVWPVVYPPESLLWEYDNFWSGKYTAEEKQGYTWSAIHVLSPLRAARYWRIEIDDTLNQDGYIEIGRVFIGSFWQPIYNYEYGASLGFEARTVVDESIGGAEFFERRESPRVMRFILKRMSDNEGHANALELTRQAGTDREIFVIPDPDDTLHMLRKAFLARMRTLSPLEYPIYNLRSMAFELKELL